MKQKDIVTIVAIVVVSAFFSFMISKVFISSPKNRTAKVEVVQKITPDFPEPSKKYFNSNSVNPTQLITIGDGTNTKPFNEL